MKNFFIVVLLLVVIGVFMQEQEEGKSGGSSDSGDTSSTTSSTNEITSKPSKPSKPVIPISDQQEEFINIVTRFKSDYGKAPNELKKSALRRKRRVSIEEFLGNDLSVQLVGKITRLSTTGEQNAHIRISLLGTKIITVSNYNNELSDIGSDTLILATSSLYDTVSDLGEGNAVKFTGSFLSGEKDYIIEQSLTEDGAMTDPEFVFKFNGIEKIG